MPGRAVLSVLGAGFALVSLLRLTPPAPSAPPSLPVRPTPSAETAATPSATAEPAASPAVLVDLRGRRPDAPHDPWSDDAEQGATCRAALAAAGVSFRALPDRKAPDAQGCGIPHPVFVTRGPTGITYGGPLLIDCSLALELPAIERVLQEQAQESFGEPIVRVTTLGTYACRPKRGSARKGISEHALGNAIDLASFHGKGRRAWASVALHYDPQGKLPPSTPGEFLHGVQRRLRHETRLTRVLGPDWNIEHRDHFHLDRGLPGWWPRS